MTHLQGDVLIDAWTDVARRSLGIRRLIDIDHTGEIAELLAIGKGHARQVLGRGTRGVEGEAQIAKWIGEVAIGCNPPDTVGIDEAILNRRMVCIQHVAIQNKVNEIAAVPGDANRADDATTSPLRKAKPLPAPSPERVGPWRVQAVMNSASAGNLAIREAK